MKANIGTLIFVAVVLGVGLGMLLLHPSIVHWDVAKRIGAGLFALSLPLFVIARVQLGGSFSVRAKATKLVTTGLYARIRNPIYVFGGMLAMGISLFVSPWGPLVLAVVLIPLQVVRARNEATALRAEFGEEYERYRAGTWF